jgi:hypothetical protein
MTDPFDPAEDPVLDQVLGQLLRRKAERAAAVAPPFEAALARATSRRTDVRRRVVAIGVLGVLAFAAVVAGVGLAGWLGSRVPVGTSPSTSPSTYDVASLRRPLAIPTLAPGGACPLTPVGLTLESLGAFQGSGPVRVNDLEDVQINELPVHNGWYGQKVFWAVDAREPGPILVRVVRIDGPGAVGLGTDLTSELMLSNDTIGLYPAVGSEPSFPLQRIFVDGVSFREPGCYLMQMDGPATTSTVVFRALGPISSSPASSVDALEALHRPLHLPSLPAGAPCPITPTTTPAGLTSLTGGGPVYPMTTTVGGVVFFDPASSPNGPGALVTWVAAPGFQGPVLIRGGSLRGGGALTFGPTELPELVITSADIPTPIGPPGWSALESDLTVIPDAGCYAYQLDGPTFSTIITFAAQPAAGLAAALQRPLSLPSLATGASCPTTAPRQIVSWSGPAIGPGPVYSVGYDASGDIRWAGSLEDGGWYYIKIGWLVAPETGPILIRGRQLDGGNQVGFGSDPGPSPELVLEASDAVGVSGSAPGWLNYVAYTRVRAPGCYAYQVDTGAGSETITFKAGP